MFAGFVPCRAARHAECRHCGEQGTAAVAEDRQSESGRRQQRGVDTDVQERLCRKQSSGGKDENPRCGIRRLKRHPAEDPAYEQITADDEQSAGDPAGLHDGSEHGIAVREG